MKFGLFGSAQARRAGPDTDSSQGFRDFIDNNVEAEALGYYSTFLVEHHFTGFGQVSASLNLLTWLGARTRHLRLGTAVLVLPWHNPVLLAEQAATLDLLSGGRLDFGVGKGYRWNEFAGFCVPMEEADERFEEVLDVITKAFVSETPFSHRGKYWQFDNIVVEPPAAQKPHPPFWMGAGSANSVRQVAERGYNMLLGPAFACRGNPGTGRPVQKRGRGPRPPVRPDGGRGRPRGPFRHQRRRQGSRARTALSGAYADQRPGPRPDGEARARFILGRRRGALRKRRKRAVRHPRRDHPQARRLRAGGVEYVIINFGGSRENIRRFAREIMPVFADEPAALALAGK